MACLMSCDLFQPSLKRSLSRIGSISTWRSLDDRRSHDRGRRRGEHHCREQSNYLRWTEEMLAANAAMRKGISNPEAWLTLLIPVLILASTAVTP